MLSMLIKVREGSADQPLALAVDDDGLIAMLDPQKQVMINNNCQPPGRKLAQNQNEFKIVKASICVWLSIKGVGKIQGFSLCSSVGRQGLCCHAR